LKKILFASNGGKPSRDAGSLLRRFGDPGKVAVTVNVCNSVEFAFPQEPWRYGDERRARPQPPEVAAEEVGLFEEAGFRADSNLGSGIPAEQILEELEKGYGVAMLGAGSTRWLDNMLLGSTSTRVLHDAPTPVLIVHQYSSRPDPVRVLLATDRSEDSALAVQELIDLADPSKVTVKVVSVADAVPEIRRLVPDALSTDEVGEYLQKAAVKSAELAAAPLREAGFEVTLECPTGEPVKEILELSRNADLVVCGSSGMGRASRFLLGSVSEQLARLAPATLVCRRGGRKR
jgi:nucleotide-binding universal stress UspA family protein